MRVCFLVASMAAAFSAAAPLSHSRPIDGVYARKTEVTSADGWFVTKRFRGGERASVQVTRSTKIVTTVHITVHDDKGNLIVEDKGRSTPASDMVAVVWYPPRDADYRIVVRNTEGAATTYFVAIR